MSERIYAEVVIACDAVIGTDPLGSIYCRCRSIGRALGVDAARAEAVGKATGAGWRLIAQIGRDLCPKHATETDHSSPKRP